MRVKGKLIRRSLKTQVLSVATSRLHNLERKELQIAEHATAYVRGKMIFGETLAVYCQRAGRVCFCPFLRAMVGGLPSQAPYSKRAGSPAGPAFTFLLSALSCPFEPSPGVQGSRFEVRGWMLNLRCSARPVNRGPMFSLQLFLRAFSTSFSSSGNSFAFEARSK
jgi:hypothetical protein